MNNETNVIEENKVAEVIEKKSIEEHEKNINSGLKKVSLMKYFNIMSAKQDDKINFNVKDFKDIDALPFVGRSSTNNGIVDYVEKREGFVNDGNVLTIALDGSTGSTFYQYHDFHSGQNIWVAKPYKEYLPELTPKVAMFLITTISLAVKSYTYNLSLTKKRLANINIYLPIKEDETIDVDYINTVMNKIRNINMIENISMKRLV